MSEEKTEEKTELRQEDLALDARLLADAVIELNISRRNVGLYPAGHVHITGAIDRAAELLSKLLQMRSSITLGITKNSLVIDNKSLDTRNPVFQDCARSFHNLGMAGLTFRSGLQRTELIKLHELMTMQPPLTGKALAEEAGKRGLSHLTMIPLDHSKFAFLGDKLREVGPGDGSGKGRGGRGPVADACEDYVYGLLEGTLIGDEATDLVYALPPEAVAEAVERAAPDFKSEESYEKVISSYIGSTNDKLSPNSLKKLSAMLDNLTPETRQQFLEKASQRISTNTASLEKTLSNMPATDVEALNKLISENSEGIPQSLRNVIDRFSTLIRDEKAFRFDILTPSGNVVHDIELGESLLPLFVKDNYKSFVNESYIKQLEFMANSRAELFEKRVHELEHECHEEVIDRTTSEIMLEVLGSEMLEPKDFLKITTTLTNMSREFVSTGRFEETLNIYNTLYSHCFGGRFAHEATGAVEYFFRSEAFTKEVLINVRLWGRQNRAGVVRLVRVLKGSLLAPLLDMLAEEPSATMRKFLITLLIDIGSDVIAEAAPRLKDSRWYVVRNMLLLLRAVGRKEQAELMRPFLKHPDPRVSGEALAGLLHFKDRQGVPFLRARLAGKEQEAREQAVRLAGQHKVREVLPLLIELAEEKTMIGEEVFYKSVIVRALAEIGDPSAIATLVKVYKSRPLFYKGAHDELRCAIFKSLHLYPRASIRPLLELGLKSEDEEIIAACKRLLAGKAGTAMEEDQNG